MRGVCRTGLEVGAELGAAADALNAQVRDLEAQIATMRTRHEDEIARLKIQLAEAQDARPNRLRKASKDSHAKHTSLARKFWDTAMQEVADLMRRGATEMDTETVMLQLDPETRAKAVSFQTITPGLLASKMGERARRGYFFEEASPGVFRLRGASKSGTSSS